MSENPYQSPDLQSLEPATPRITVGRACATSGAVVVALMIFNLVVDLSPEGHALHKHPRGLAGGLLMAAYGLTSLMVMFVLLPLGVIWLMRRVRFRRRSPTATPEQLGSDE